MDNTVVTCSLQNVEHIYQVFKDGGIIVFPTDTVYGIGCNPYDYNAVKKIYKIKQRQKNKHLPILGFSQRDLQQIAYFNNTAQKIAANLWPGPITLILELKELKIGSSLGISNNKIAVRVPKNDCTLSILQKCRLIIGTSANRSGVKSFIDPKKCIQNISGYNIFVDGGVIKNSSGESTIIDCTQNNDELVILRQGAITKQEIEKIL